MNIHNYTPQVHVCLMHKEIPCKHNFDTFKFLIPSPPPLPPPSSPNNNPPPFGQILVINGSIELQVSTNIEIEFQKKKRMRMVKSYFYWEMRRRKK